MKLMNTIFLSCKKATALLEKKLHVKLSFTQRMQLKMHTAMCKPCSKYEEQSAILEEHLKNNYKSTHIEAEVIEALKVKISHSLAEDI